MKNTPHPLVLWDIDGTLLRGNGSLITFFLQALRDVYGVAQPTRIDYGGKTDQQIVVETLALHTIGEKQALASFERFSAQYQGRIAQHAASLPPMLQVLPGVRAVLEQLQHMNVPQSLLTGNIASVAMHKLQAVGLAHFFDWELGAYGSDHRDRNQLVPIVRRKAQVRYGLEIERVAVVGDTAHDIACARAGGAHAVAVATGKVSLHELAAHEPDALLPDLSDIDAALSAILNNDQYRVTSDK
jgi:phosphoglycolate phosphatase-like HAD superfamily hydrolase